MDYERLREDLKDYFGSAMQFYPVAVMDLVEVERASDEKLEQIAISNGFDLREYEIQKSR